MASKRKHGLFVPAILIFVASFWALLTVLTVFNSSKIVALAVLAVTFFPLCLYFTGNARLFLLFAMVCAAPFGLSLNFKTLIHIGGSPSFSIDLMDFFLVGLIIFLIRDYVWGRRQHVRLSTVSYWWIGLIILGMISMAVGPFRYVASFEVLRMIKHLLLFLVIINECVRVRHFQHVVYALIFGVAVQIAVALLQAVVKQDLGLQMLGEAAPEAVEGANLGVYQISGAVYRVGALMGHPNLLSAYLSLLLPIMIALLFSRVAGVLRFTLIVLCGLGLVALILTFSRSGWIAFTIGFFLLLAILFHNRYIRNRFGFLKFSLLSSSVVALIIGSPLIIRRLTKSDSGALDFRYEWMDVAWRMVEAKPLFGFGLNSFVYHMPPYTSYQTAAALNRLFGEAWPPVHNIYLLVWSEQGTIGFLLFLAMHISIIAIAIKNLRYYINDRLFAINVGALCGFLAVMVDGYASFFTRVPASGRMYWIVVGLIVAIHYWNVSNAASLQDRHSSTGSNRTKQPVGSIQAISR